MDTVAAVSFVETAPETYGAGSIFVAGRGSCPVVGPVLDGVGSAAIDDMYAGALDADTRRDRAVGPMQFIPSAWQLVE